MPLVEGCVTAALNFRVVDEKVFSTVIRGNKTKTFTCIEPFNYTCAHISCTYVFESHGTDFLSLLREKLSEGLAWPAITAKTEPYPHDFESATPKERI